MEGAHVSRRSSDPTFPSKGFRSGAGAYGAFLYRSFARLLDGLPNMLLANVMAADIVQSAVVCFSHRRIDGPYVLVAGLPEDIVCNGLRRRPDGQGVSQDNRRFDDTELLHLGHAHQLPKSISDL